MKPLRTAIECRICKSKLRAVRVSKEGVYLRVRYTCPLCGGFISKLVDATSFAVDEGQHAESVRKALVNEHILRLMDFREGDDSG